MLHVGISLAFKGQDYRVERLECDCDTVDILFAMAKDNGETHFVALGRPDSCTCRDFICRKLPLGESCKHILAARHLTEQSRTEKSK